MPEWVALGLLLLLLLAPVLVAVDLYRHAGGTGTAAQDSLVGSVGL